MASSVWENLLVVFLGSIPFLIMVKWSWFGVFCIKVLAVIIDFLVLTPQIIYQQPWATWLATRRIRAVREDENDPESPFVRIGDPLEFDRQVLESPTIAHWFDTMTAKFGDSNCMGSRPVLSECEEKQANGKILKKYLLADDYFFISYKQVKDKVKQIGDGLSLNGVKAGDKVVLFSETREEWLLSAFAIWKLGAITVTMYANLGLDGILAILEQTQATHIVTSADSLDKLAKIADKLNYLTTIICAKGANGKEPTPLPSLSKFKMIPFNQLVNKYDAPETRQTLPSPHDIACIMYTSGSTGIPKGVQISHANFMSAMQALLTSAVGSYKHSQHEAYLAYLPLAHIFEMGAEVLMFSMGIPICYSSPMTMLDSSTAIKKGCKGDISVIKPTIMPAVPLILDRIKKTIEDKLSTSEFFKYLFEFAIEYKKFWVLFGFETPFMDYLAFSKVRQPLGGNLKLIFVGGAPLSVETQQFISLTLGVKLLQGYAATEGTACAALMDMEDRSLGRCGAPLFGAKLKLIDWPEGGYSNHDQPNPRGELVIGGPAITMGYYMNEEETAKVYWVDEDGTRWWRSGDIGEVFEDGTIKIIDRKKDLIKLQHGEYISLGKVEAVLKNCNFVDNICVYGDSFHSYLIAFILPERNSLKRLAESLGKQDVPFNELCNDQQIVNSVLETLREFGESANLLRFEIPNKIKLCSEEWTPDNGLATAALKIRRLEIQKFYKQSIESLYAK
ncbi:long-chain-fatty-acid--CoA ligase 4 [Tetranychus urticae]|uniref:long-chain-fatty-acid--CoA ligase n=1 Tax=Tetranychus urticae TaxID=32264 RepID=T1KH01_TETUR|nr:long-chain-fatty-acid--CoA ligase 4 [Tetranychus urticae]